MLFEAPKMYCPKCHKEIPANGAVDCDRWGNPIKDEEGDYVLVKTPQLGCKSCAIDVLPPGPKRPRRKREDKDPDQMVIDAPTVFIS